MTSRQSAGSLSEEFRVRTRGLSSGRRWSGPVRRAPVVRLAPGDSEVLEAWAAPSTGTPRRARRARIVLEASRGATNGQIARLLDLHPETVALWRGRYATQGLEGVRHDAPRPGSGRRSEPGLVERIVRTTLEVEPPNGRWTTRSLASELRVSHMLVYRVWKSQGLRPRTGRDGALERTVRTAQPPDA